jgi:hypothetical protein
MEQAAKGEGGMREGKKCRRALISSGFYPPAVIHLDNPNPTANFP